MIESKPPLPPEAPPATSPATSSPQEFWTYREVAALCRVTLQTVQEWVKRGRIPSPVYIGFTARFTADQVADIMMGAKPIGSFAVAASPRAEIGKLGGSSKKPKKGKASNPSQVKQRIEKNKKWAKANTPKPKPSTKKKPTTTKGKK